MKKKLIYLFSFILCCSSILMYMPYKSNASYETNTTKIQDLQYNNPYTFVKENESGITVFYLYFDANSNNVDYMILSFSLEPGTWCNDNNHIINNTTHTFEECPYLRQFIWNNTIYYEFGGKGDKYGTYSINGSEIIITETIGDNTITVLTLNLDSTGNLIVIEAFYSNSMCKSGDTLIYGSPFDYIADKPAINEWVLAKDTWFYFDENGRALTDWQEINGNWYYFYENGAMAADEWIDSYYLTETGEWLPNAVEKKWFYQDDKWWYQNADGSYPTNTWKFINDNWYHFAIDGWMETGWILDGTTWYYLNYDGSMATGWVNDSGTWYYMDQSGAMKTGWVEIIEKDEDNKEYSTWYYMETSGAMKTGWLNDNGTWYYLNDSGVMVTDTVIDGCTIDENGIWVQ